MLVGCQQLFHVEYIKFTLIKDFIYMIEFINKLSDVLLNFFWWKHLKITRPIALSVITACDFLQGVDSLSQLVHVIKLVRSAVCVQTYNFWEINIFRISGTVYPTTNLYRPGATD